jgi:hypothetical protein
MLLRVVISMSMGAAMRKAKAIFALQRLERGGYSPQAALLMLECDRSLASHRYTPTDTRMSMVTAIATKKMQMKDRR